MIVDSVELKARLMGEDPDFQHLVSKHRELDKKIGELDDRILLTTEDEMEMRTLKKQKLHLKDQIQNRLDLFRQQAQKGQGDGPAT